MNKKMEVFDFQSQEVRVLLDDKQGPWFVGKDVCSYFGDTDHKRSLSRIDDDEKSTGFIDTPGGKQEMIIVNEAGLYSLLFLMQPEKARLKGGAQTAPPSEDGVPQISQYVQDRLDKIKAFKRWITHEVIPSIRKTGSYSIEKPTGTKALVAQAELQLQMLKQMAEFEERQFEHDARLNDIEMVIATLPDPNYKTVIAWANEHYKRITSDEAQTFGRKCTMKSRLMGIAIERVPHPCYGEVNAYHVDVLRQVMS